MSSLNKCHIIGRLGQNPEMRYTKSNTAVATFSVATTERYKDRNGEQQENTEWHRIVAWGRLAEICQEYLRKGSLAYFEGTIQTREWEDKDGRKRYTTEIKALSMQMLDSQPEKRTEKPQAPVADNSLDDIDDSLPFLWLLIPFGYTLMSLI